MAKNARLPSRRLRSGALIPLALCAAAVAAGAAADSPRKLVTITAHTDFVSALAFSPEGDRLLSASADKTVVITDPRDGKVLRRITDHPDAIFGLTLSPTGKEAFVAGGVFEGKGPYSISKLDVAARRELGSMSDSPVLESYTGHDNAITAMAQSNEGSDLATGDLTGLVRIWKTGTGSAGLDAFGAKLTSDIEKSKQGIDALLAKLKAKESGGAPPPPKPKAPHATELRVGAPVLSLALSSDGALIAVGSVDGLLRIYDLPNKAQRVLAGHTGKVLSLAFQYGSHLLASGGEDKAVRLWDADTAAAKATLAGSEGAVFALAFLNDGRQLASGGKDSQVRVWDIAGQRAAYTLPESTGYVRSLAVDRGARLLAAGTKSGAISVYRLPFGRDVEAAGSVFAKSKSGGTDGAQLVIDTQEHTDRVSQVVFTKDGRQVITGSWDKTVRIWDAATGEALRTIRLPSYAGTQGMIYAMALSPDERFLAVAGASVEAEVKHVKGGGEYISLIDLKTGELADVAGHHMNVIFALGYSPDGKSIVTGAGDNDEKALIYSVSPEGKLSLSTGALLGGMVLGAKFSADGKYVFAADGLGMLARIEPGDLSEFKIPNTTRESIQKALLLDDGREARQAKGQAIGESLKRKMNKMIGRELDSSCAIYGLAVDPTGKWVAIGDALGAVQLYSAKQGLPDAPQLEDKVLVTGSPQNGAAGALAFTRDGKRLAVGTSKLVRVVEVESGKEVGRFEQHGNTVFSVAFSPDGSKVVSTSGNGSGTYIWDVATGKALVQLGGKRALPKVWALGAHKTDPGLLGLGNRDPRSTVNDYGSVEYAFDFPNLRLVPAVDAAQFESAAQSNARLQAKTPEFAANPQTVGSKLLSWLALPNGRAIVGTEFGAHYRDPFVKDLNHDGVRVNAFALGADGGQTFYVGLEDGRVEIYDTSTLQRLATLLVTADKEWVLFSPDGYYAASRGGAKAVGWLMNHGVTKLPGYYPFEQFDLRLNRPDLVLARLGYPGVTAGTLQALRGAREKRLKKMGLDESKLAMDTEAPAVTLGRVADVAKAKKLDLEITARPAGSPLDRLQVWANDVPLYGSAGISLAGEKGAVKKRLSVELTAGRNKLQVSVLDAHGVESPKETAYVTYPGPVKPPDLYVLAIGVSAYQDAAWKLDYAAKDAADLAAAFKKDGQAGFGNLYVQPLLDQAVTKEGVIAAKKFLQKSKPDDQVVVFIAGHGLVDEKNEYYFGTVDVSFTDPAARGLPYDAIEGLLDGIPARKKLLLMDTCHSGEIDKEAMAPIAASSADGQLIARVPGTRGLRRAGDKQVTSDALGGVLGSLFTDLRRGSGAMVISSASGQQLAIEGGSYKNGVFTYALLQGLASKQADLNGDGQVKVGELRDYVIQKVTQLTQGQQTPTSRRENLEFDFTVLQYGRQ